MLPIDAKAALVKFGGHKFDYSLVSNELSLSGKLKIRCLTHDEAFQQNLALHLKGNIGCPSCRAEGEKRNKGVFSHVRAKLHGGIIYELTCTKLDQVFIGETTMPLELRWLMHLKEAAGREIGDQRFLNEAILKYGPHDFTAHVIEEVAHDSELKPRRRDWIQKLRSQDPLGLNTVLR